MVIFIVQYYKNLMDFFLLITLHFIINRKVNANTHRANLRYINIILNF